LYQFTRTVLKLTVVIIMRYYCYQLYTKFYQIFSQGYVHMVDEILADHQCRFQRNRSTTEQIVCIHQIFDEKLVI
jgi:hypothetical protein